jgi:4'-phosphopantetheinyl transferase
MSPQRQPGPTGTPATADGEVDVWWAELDDPGWQLADGLSDPERERAGSLREGVVRRRWIASRRALRSVLGRYLGGEGEVPSEFVLGPAGKPTLPAPQPVQFNLSHSGALALVAVAAGLEVGIDLELIDRDRDVDALIPHALDGEGRALVDGAAPGERVVAFHRAWVRREAIAKCGGEGLTGAPSMTPVAVTPLEMGDDYVAALAVAAPTPVCPRLFTAVPPAGIRP